MKKTFGGQRIGSGNNMTFDTKTFNRSTHNLSEIFRSTMSAGTLVPFYVSPTLPGDTRDIKLNAMVRTLPAIGPLFGSAKIQLDLYQVVIRQYNRDLQMNKLEVGRNIEKIKFPQVELKANNINVGLQTLYSKGTPWGGKEMANCQIEPSTIMSYLGIKGLGQGALNAGAVKRSFNAIPWLAYWDIYKNYYANKQEVEAYYIHNDLKTQEQLVNKITLITNNASSIIQWNTDRVGKLLHQIVFILEFSNQENYNQFLENEFNAQIKSTQGGVAYDTTLRGTKDFIIQRQDSELKIYFTWKGNAEADVNFTLKVFSSVSFDYIRPNVRSFELANIDTMRDIIMNQSGQVPLILDDEFDTLEPYSSIFRKIDEGTVFEITSLQCKQEGLGLKTYQSDIYNNFLNTEWITGENGVSELTSIKVDEDGKFTLDEFNIKKKVYDMLNHIAASGGSYDDWQETVYGVERVKQVNSPMYEGGLSKELVFEEVVSNSASNAQGEQALGTLAGRGVMGDKHKGGNVVIKCNEPGYIIGIASITPRIDYSQGNAWYTNLKNLGELHNPYLDAIAYQDLITDTMGFWDTKLDALGNPTFKSAGKQPSWINYQTSTNKLYGNFALENEQMFMVFARKYETAFHPVNGYSIGDVTTYIDPLKYNHIYADASPDAMNYWVQISIEDEARRVMSANQIPNL